MDKQLLFALRGPVAHRMMDHGLCQLRYVGRRTGRLIALPVQYARHGTDVVVYVGDAGGKSWWRNFLAPRPVEVMIRGDRYDGVGRVVASGMPEWADARAVYRGEHPRLRVDDRNPLVVVHLLPPDAGLADRGAAARGQTWRGDPDSSPTWPVGSAR